MFSENEKILDVAVAVNSAKSVSEILSVVMERVGQLMSYDRSSIALLDPDSRTLEIRELSLSAPAPGAATEKGKKIPVEDSNALGWAVLNRQPHLRRSLQEFPQFKPQQETREVPSHIIAPLLGREEVLGVLTIGSYTAEAFDEKDVSLFTYYARLAAVAIQNLRLFERAQELAVKDGLTGAYNHRHFKEVLDQEINRMERYNSVFSLLLLDIDHFKDFNDSYGHQAGDRLLVQTVRILGQNLRPSDLVFRYGGEEFAVLLPSTSTDPACSVARTLLSVLRKENTYTPDRNTVYRVTASLGVATAPADARTREGLIACADQALYHAKSEGRDRMVAFSQIDEVQRLQEKLGGGRDADLLPELLKLAILSSEGRDTHIQRVTKLADLLAETLQLSPEERINLKIAAYFHDVGEAGIPGHVLRKPGPLNEQERTLIQTHPVVGESLLKRAIRIREILAAVLHHHERFDGAGYPMGLRAEQIPLLARVLAVAEVFDALVSPRPYREPLPVAQAYDTLRSAAGYQLDPELVDRFIEAHSGSSSE